MVRLGAEKGSQKVQFRTKMNHFEPSVKVLQSLINKGF